MSFRSLADEITQSGGQRTCRVIERLKFQMTRKDPGAGLQFEIKGISVLPGKTQGWSSLLASQRR